MHFSLFQMALVTFSCGGIKPFLPKRGMQFSSLSFDVVGGPSAKEVVVFMHGILGNKRNWKSACNEFVKLRPDYKAISVDHRGHGNSPSFSDNNSVKGCAADLHELFKVEILGIEKSPTILCGHSFSGKVALTFLSEVIESRTKQPKHVWIIDSIPGKYDKFSKTSDQQTVVGIIGCLKSLPRSFESKQWVIERLLKSGIHNGIVQWLAMNIVPTGKSDNSVKFSFDIEMVEAMFEDFCDTDMFPFLESYSGDAMIHFIRAGKNKQWLSNNTLERFDEIQRKNSRIKLYNMPHVGHWVHTDDLHGTFGLIHAKST